MKRENVLRCATEVHVAGIPCLAVISSYCAGRPAKLYGPMEDCYPAEDPEVEFDIYDRKGYPAAWLEKKLTDRDVDNIVMALFESMED